MATVLELAREVRHRLVSKDTGCLTIDFPDKTITLYFRFGTVASDSPVFQSCFLRTPLAFKFRSMEVPNPGESGQGVSTLIEAIDAMDRESLVHAWEPYAEWKIGFRIDPEIHNTMVREHLSTSDELLRRLMRLVVSGSASLEPPITEISDEMNQIEIAFKSGNWWKVLNVKGNPDQSETKQAYRKLARRFHPDRWATSPDIQLRERIERTFQRVSCAYRELKQSDRIQSGSSVEPKPERSFWERISGFARSK